MDILLIRGADNDDVRYSLSLTDDGLFEIREGDHNYLADKCLQDLVVGDRIDNSVNQTAISEGHSICISKRHREDETWYDDFKFQIIFSEDFSVVTVAHHRDEYGYWEVKNSKQIKMYFDLYFDKKG